MAAFMNPCPQCGATLRWIPEANYWNCDRCGNRLAPSAAPPTPQPASYQPPGGHPHDQSGLHPPQQQGYPPQQQGYPPQQHGYPPQGYGHYPQHGPPKGKGKLIAIIVVGLALAAGGIVLAVVLSKKGSDGGGGGGFDSSEALAKSYVETLAAGDGEKLVGLSPPVDMLAEYSDCPPEKLEENKKQYAETLDKGKQAAGAFKGHALVYKSVETIGDKKEFKAGDPMGECKAKKPFAMAEFVVNVEFEAADKSKQTFRAGMPTLIFDGKYYLGPGAAPPPDALTSAMNGTPTAPPDTPTPAPPAPAGDPAALQAEMDALKTASCACSDKACADAQWSKLMAFVETNKATLEAPGAEALNAAGSESVKCLDKLRMGSVPPPEPTPPRDPTPPSTPTEPATPGKGLPECEAYAKAAERFIKCGKVPKQSRDAVQTAVDTMRKNWGDTSTMSEDMRKSAAETCVTLEKSMKDAAKAIGCK